MKAGLYILIILLFANASIAQSSNFSFESWYIDSLGYYRLTNWQHYSGRTTSRQATTLYGTARSDTAKHGNYALRLSRWYNYTCDWVQQVAAINAKPLIVKGYYKYEQNTLKDGYIDSALVEIIVTKWNTINNIRDTIGFGRVLLLATSNYKVFNFPIQYYNNDIPDTTIINIRPMPWDKGHDNTTGTGSFLTIDNLSLEFQTNTITEAPSKEFYIYPNPTKTCLNVDVRNNIHYTISNETGRIVLGSELTKGNNKVDLSKFAPGIYIITISNHTSITQRLKFIKE